LFPEIVLLLPTTVTSLWMAVRSPASVIVPSPAWSVIVWGPAAALAPMIACRNEPAPESLVLVTSKFAAPASPERQTQRTSTQSGAHCCGGL
jgi:hypothetical protein